MKVNRREIKPYANLQRANLRMVLRNHLRFTDLQYTNLKGVRLPNGWCVGKQ